MKHKIACVFAFFILLAGLKAQFADSSAFNAIGRSLDSANRLKDAELASAFYEKAIKFIKTKKYTSGFNWLIKDIEETELEKGNYKKALESYFELAKVADEIHDLGHKGVILNGIGILYWYEGDFKNALRFYMEDVEIMKKLGNQGQLAAVYNNIGLVYRQMNAYDKAVEYYNKALLLSISTKDEISCANAYNNIGVLYELQEHYVKALYYFNKSLDIRKQANDSIGIATSLGNIGSVYFKLDKLDEAEDHLLRSYEISERMNDLEGIKEVSAGLSELYEKEKDGMKSLIYYRQFIMARDSLVNEETKREAMKKEMEYKFEQEQQKKSIVAEEEKRRQKLYTYSALIILLIVSVFSIVLFNRFNITKRQNKIIQAQKHLVEEKNKEILDSIRYAKRIQNSLLPPDRFLDKILKRFSDKG